MVATVTVDPYAAADAAKTNNAHYFANVSVDAFNAVLVKGTGKVVYDPAQHTPDQRVTAIKLTLSPLPRAGRTQNSLEWNMIAESREWTRIVNPSLKALNVGLKGIHNKWCHLEAVDTGRRYFNKDGEEKIATTLKFVAVFDTQEACQAAADAYYVSRGVGQVSTPPAQTPSSTPASPPSSAERLMAAKFLTALYKSAQATAGPKGDVLTAFVAAIQKNGLTNAHFGQDTLNQPEVLAVITANQAAA